ncbi:hypothetical protein JR316_0012470 [Psilocybe cubensis]|uniref:Uncharacterized protein n=1 Tax=Psilocybe cubensis TaxID=181762 RepID=A0ACB8GIC9_PSICU|nr:hypothetical protein JR316_0012470 [Psilocybe cubensis]KAH9475359.1 hypothetical protein JR316_0012470 [Psilocybe cubensis]
MKTPEQNHQHAHEGGLTKEPEAQAAVHQKPKRRRSRQPTIPRSRDGILLKRTQETGTPNETEAAWSPPKLEARRMTPLPVRVASAAVSGVDATSFGSGKGQKVKKKKRWMLGSWIRGNETKRSSRGKPPTSQEPRQTKPPVMKTPKQNHQHAHEGGLTKEPEAQAAVHQKPKRRRSRQPTVPRSQAGILLKRTQETGTPNETETAWSPPKQEAG